jgi:hypothetical protein
MVSAGVLFVACALMTFGNVQIINGRKIILNEDVLVNTCTMTCEDIHDLHDREGCMKISGCNRSSYGWNRGFVRCDYCECECEEDTDDRDVLEERTRISTNEYELYGRCTGFQSCNRFGLVRTDFKGCQRLENCQMADPEEILDLLFCDYCTCQCVNERYAQKYTLTDIKYDVENARMKKGRPFALNKTTFIKVRSLQLFFICIRPAGR